jgi:Tfp pilus assembly protein PilX
MKKNKTKNKNNGFVLMIVLLLVSVVLVVGLGVFDIILGEIALSIAGRESQKSLYAADSGIECALYWDLKQMAFNSSSYTINCAGRQIQNNMIASTTTFDLVFENGACAQVTVDKVFSPVTTITSRGYNISGESGFCDSNSSRKVERAMRNAY